MNAIKEHIVKNKMRYLLAMIVLAQIIWMTYCFAFEKKGFHSDEIWSYSPATDSESMKFTFDRDYNQKHFNEWFSGNEFFDYLSIDESERFQYSFITDNIKRDLHMPLYFWIMHTILSFFPNRFSWWFGFAVNIFFFLIAQVYLFKLVKKILKNEFYAVCVCLLYGFSQGGINTYIFIRMYSVITALGIVLFYYHYDLFDNKELKLKNILLCGVITYFGGITHIYFLLFAGIVAGISCVVYVLRREYKKLFVYALSMLMAAVLTFVTFPYILNKAVTYFSDNYIKKTEAGISETKAVEDAAPSGVSSSMVDESGVEHIILSDTKGHYKGFWYEFRYFRYYLFRQIFGITWIPLPSYFFIHLAELLIYASVIVVPFCFLCRKEKWYKSGVVCLKEHLLKLLSGIRKKIFNRLSLINWVMVLTCIVYFLIIILTSRIVVMGDCSTRYVFILYPYIYLFITLAFIEIVRWVCRIIRNRSGFSKHWNDLMTIGILAIFVGVQAVVTDKPYYFTSGKNMIYLSELPKKANYIITLNAEWLLDCCAYELQGVETVFATFPDDLEKNLKTIDSLTNEYPVYCLLTPEIVEEAIQNVSGKEVLDDIETMEMKYEQKYEQIINKLSLSDRFERVGTTSVFGRELRIYRIR